MPWRWAMQAAVHHGGPTKGVANGLILWRKKGRLKPCLAADQGKARIKGWVWGPWQGTVKKGTVIRMKAGPRRDGPQRVWLSFRAAVQARAWVWA